MLARYRSSSDWPQLSPIAFTNWAAPWRTLDFISQQLNRAWGDLDRYGQDVSNYGEGAQLADKGSELVLTVELPGVSKDGVELSVTGDNIFLRASREVEPPKGYTAHRRERSSYKFEHAWKLPAPVDAQKAEAQMRDGVLTVTLPKAPNATPKQITVTAG